MNFENRLFTSGQMDSDSSPSFIENGKYLSAVNIRPYNPENGDVGEVTPVPGNIEVEYDFELYSGAFFRVVGSKLDLKRRRMYWLVYAKDTTIGFPEKAFILYYEYDTQDVIAIYKGDNSLELDPNFPIKDIDIYYDDTIGDTLLWVDGNTEPKKYNVTAGFNRFNNYTDDITGFTVGDIVFANYETKILTSPRFFIPCVCVTATNDYPTYDFTTGLLSTANFATLPIGACYPPFIKNTLFYQKPITPRYSPIATFNYDTDDSNQGAGTFLRRKSYQFCYKYVLFDGQETEWSPKSEAVLSQELTSGIFSNGESELISPEFPTPKSVSVKVPIMLLRATLATDETSVIDYPASMIQRVKIAIREVPNTKTPGDWYLFQDIDYSEFFKYNVTSVPIGQGFPIPGTPGTYFYNWDTNSYYWYNQDGTAAVSISTITVDYNGTQTLVPIDVLDATTLFYNLPKTAVAQTLCENRVIHGAGKFGMDVSKEVVNSIQDNLSITPLPQSVEFDAENLTTQLFAYNSGGSTSIIGDNIAQIVWSIPDFDALELNSPFSFSFQIQVTIQRSFLGDPLAPLSYDRTISGSFPGISPDFANYNDFIEAQILAAFPDINPATAPGSNIFLSVSANNTTGELTLQFEDQLAIVVIDSISLAIIPSATNEGFFQFASYFPERTFKNNSTQQYGIAFADAGGRMTNVVETESLSAEFGHFINYDLEPEKFFALLEGLSDIVVPEDAVAVHILRKRSESYQDYIHFALSETNSPSQSWNYDKTYFIGYINLELDDISGSLPAQNGPNKFYCTLNSVNGGDGAAYQSIFETTILDFTPQAGDVFRFLYRMDASGNIIEKYDSSFVVESYSELWNTLVVDFNDIQEKEPSLASYLSDNFDQPIIERIVCEVTKGRDISQQEFYWEVAAQYSCSNGKVDVNPASDGVSLFGDAYIKLRGYCVDYDPVSSNTFQNFPIIDKNYNDFAPSNNVGEGRPNAIVKSIQRGQNIQSEIFRDNLITYSEQSIQNTDVRRLATIFDTNIQEVSNIFGSIQHLYTDGDSVRVYQEDKFCMFYVGRSITTELSGAERVIASQNNVFSPVIYNKGNYGISTDGASYAVVGYRKYFTDRKRGSVYRESMDGVTAISEVGMSGYFKRIFREVRNSFTKPIIRGIVDERTDEYILSITYSKVFSVVADVSTTPINLTFYPPEEASQFQIFSDNDPILIDINTTGKFRPAEFPSLGDQAEDRLITVLQKPPGVQAGDTIRVELPITETLVFSERTGGWTTKMSFGAEWLSAGIQSYHTFRNGQMWFHDLGNNVYNNFFGVQYDSEVEVASNANPQQVKVYKTIGVKTTASPEIASNDIITSEGQNSLIPQASFVNKEGNKTSVFYRDSNFDIRTGPKLRGRWLTANITLPTNGEKFTAFGVVFNHQESPFSQ